MLNKMSEHLKYALKQVINIVTVTLQTVYLIIFNFSALKQLTYVNNKL